MTRDRQTAELIGHDFATRLASIGIDTPLRLSADDTHWYDLDRGGTQASRAKAPAIDWPPPPFWPGEHNQ